MAIFSCLSSGVTSILASDIFAAINQSTTSSFVDAISQSLERANISRDVEVAAFGTLSAAASAGLLARFDDIFLQVGMLPFESVSRSIHPSNNPAYRHLLM